MEIVFIIPEDQRVIFNGLSRNMPDFPRVITQITRVGKDWKLTIQGTEEDINAFVNQLRDMGLILEA